MKTEVMYAKQTTQKPLYGNTKIYKQKYYKKSDKFSLQSVKITDARHFYYPCVQQFCQTLF